MDSTGVSHPYPAIMAVDIQKDRIIKGLTLIGPDPAPNKKRRKKGQEKMDMEHGIIETNRKHRIRW